jgi:hypothetical protein
MSLRPTVVPTHGPGVGHSKQTDTARLDAVLRAGLPCGAKYKDEDGREIKYVEFVPDDPKSASIARHCIKVPWKSAVYGKKSVPLGEFVDDVTADPRLKGIGLGSPFESQTSNTQDPAVQSHADAEYRLKVNRPYPGGGSGTWVLDFVGEYDEFARYCLVPINIRTVEERLERAIEHLNTVLSDEALYRYDDGAQGLAIRRYYVAQWTRALNKLKAA